MCGVVIGVDKIEAHKCVKSLLQQLLRLRRRELNGFVVACILYKLHVTLCYVFLKPEEKLKKNINYGKIYETKLRIYELRTKNYEKGRNSKISVFWV